MTELRMLTRHECMKRLGIKRTSLDNKVKEGLIPKPNKGSIKSTTWPSHEIDALIRAEIRGCSQWELKRLVEQLTHQRSQIDIFLN